VQAATYSEATTAPATAAPPAAGNVAAFGVPLHLGLLSFAGICRCPVCSTVLHERLRGFHRNSSLLVGLHTRHHDPHHTAKSGQFLFSSLAERDTTTSLLTAKPTTTEIMLWSRHAHCCGHPAHKLVEVTGSYPVRKANRDLQRLSIKEGV
jgi:hypothetical protein